MSLRMMVTAGLTTIALAVPVGAAFAESDTASESPVPVVEGGTCDPATDTAPAYDEGGIELHCLDGLWSVPTEDVPATEEEGGSEEASGEAPPPEEAPPVEGGVCDPATDTAATDADGAELECADGGWTAVEDAPVPEEGAECAVEGALHEEALECVKGDDGLLTWQPAATGGEKDEEAPGEEELPDDEAPRPSPEGEAPETECGEGTEGTQDDGHTCVCLGGDTYNWYFGDWYYYSSVWYWSYEGYYWYWLDGVWYQADERTTELVHADAKPAPSEETVDAAPASSGSDGALPVTGTALGGLALAAAAVTALGATAMVIARRRRSPASPDE